MLSTAVSYCKVSNSCSVYLIELALPLLRLIILLCAQSLVECGYIKGCQNQMWWTTVMGKYLFLNLEKK